MPAALWGCAECWQHAHSDNANYRDFVQHVLACNVLRRKRVTKKNRELKQEKLIKSNRTKCFFETIKRLYLLWRIRGGTHNGKAKVIKHPSLMRHGDMTVQNIMATHPTVVDISVWTKVVDRLTDRPTLWSIESRSSCGEKVSIT